MSGRSVDRAWKPAAWVVLVTAIVALWLLPTVAFPNPRTNDAIALSDLEWLLILLVVAGTAAALAAFRGAVAALVRAALGVFLIGAALSLVVGLMVFGNLSNDRFGPLLFFPPIFALLGLVSLVVGVGAGGPHKQELLVGAGYGLMAAVGFGAWTLARGSRDWLLAPYGFDIIALILILGAVLVLIGSSRRDP
ncbi:MAG TPA: hypothetical protein VLU92_10370 [Candidatus Dormibacteraeota bacterium]|nr:hypothetical protein [Candidatus Dormibacteraeota bacterium]